MHDRTPRTVTVRTLDRGPVAVPEPPWCLGEHPQGEHLTNLFHSGPETALTLPATRRPVTVLAACLEQRPFTGQTPPGRGTFATVEAAGDWHPMDPAGLRSLAVRLEVHAVQLRALAAELAALVEREATR